MSWFTALAGILLFGIAIKWTFVAGLFVLALAYRLRAQRAPLELPTSTKENREAAQTEAAQTAAAQAAAAQPKSALPVGFIKKWLRNDSFVWLFGASRTASILTGKIPSHAVRRFLYQHVFGLKTGKNVIIYHGAELWDAHRISIGDGAIIGDGMILDGRAGITMGTDVNISTGVWMYTYQHNVNSPTFGCEDKCGPIHIGDRAWISNRVVILPNVVIGEGAVVAAGSVVTKSIEPFAIYGGVPAKKIGERNRDLTYVFDGKHLKFY